MEIRGNLEKFPEGEARGKFFQIHDDFHIFTRGKGIYGHIHEKNRRISFNLFLYTPPPLKILARRGFSSSPTGG